MRPIKLSPRKILKVCILGLLVAGLGIPAYADIRAEFQTSSGYTSNLLNESGSEEDWYSRAQATIRFYPVSSLELTLRNDYTYYGRVFGLSNFQGGLGCVYIPTDKTSPLSLYFSGSFNTRAYREDFRGFNNDIYDAAISIGYRLLPQVRFRLGYAHNSESYTSMETGDHKTNEISFGTNLSLPGSNSLDLEVGYADMSLSYMDEPKPPRNYYLDPFHEPYIEDHLRAINFSPRFSRSLGSKVGLSIVYNASNFQNNAGKVISGLTTSLLSPWASVYEGQSVSLNLKSYWAADLVMSSGIGYWEKEFLLSVEEIPRPTIFSPPYGILQRRDWQSKFYWGVQKYISSSGAIFELALQVDLTFNNSVLNDYDYSGLSLTGGMTARF